jgi:hypothetical protein
MTTIARAARLQRLAVAIVAAPARRRSHAGRSANDPGADGRAGPRARKSERAGDRREDFAKELARAEFAGRAWKLARS